ncbi:MAG: Hpt domain-containing protein, partial [Leptospirales bacterium]
ATAMEGDRTRALKSGMTDYLTKPIDPRILLETIAKYAGDGTMKLTPARSSPKSPAVAMPALEGVDVNSGLERLGGNVQSYQALLLEFADSFGATAMEVDAAIDANAIDKATSQLHALQGAAGNLGALYLMEVAADMDNVLRSGDVATTPDRRDAFREVHARTIKAIRSGLAHAVRPERVPSKSFEPLARSVLREKLDAIDQYVRGHETGALPLLEEIEPSLACLGLGPACESLRKDLRRYDFRTAEAEVAAVRKQLEQGQRGHYGS